MAAVQPVVKSVAGAPSPPGPLKEFWIYFRQNRGAVAGLAVFIIVCFVAITADWTAPHLPDQQYRDHFLAPPAWAEGGSTEFLLGTDAVGRDILSRIMHGARYSLIIGLIVVTLSLTLGIMLGLLAAFFRGVLEISIMRSMDMMLALPSLLLELDWTVPLPELSVIVAILGPGLFNAMLAISIVYLPHLVRLTRAAAISELSKDYVTASRVSGAGLLRLMVITVLPNCMAPLIVQATLSFSRNGRAAADAGVGNHAGGGTRVRAPRVVGRDLPRRRHSGNRAGA